MRVISGQFKGRTLFTPKGMGMRPTADRVKETLFNMIGQDVVEATMLDAFAGTGSIGIEALSRGAAHVVFIEKHPMYMQILKRNLAMCRVEANSTAYHGDINKILQILHRSAQKFDMIFLDPPYKQTNMLREVLESLVYLALLSPGGMLIVEHAASFALPPVIEDRLLLQKDRRVGDTMLSFYSSALAV